MKSLIPLLTTCILLVECLPPPHRDVLAVKQEEEELLHPLQRSPALHNPHLLKILPLTSLLHEGEKLVHSRDAHDVPREEIYKMLTHAGLIPRNRYPPPTGHDAIIALFPEEQFNFHDADYFPLQYL